MIIEVDTKLSVSIKRKKPFPKIAWIGKEQEGLYLLDHKRISQLLINSGKTKKRIAKIRHLLNDICAVDVSQCGQFLCGALTDGKIFLWKKDNDSLIYITGLPKLFSDFDKGSTSRTKIFLSPCGKYLLVVTGFKKVFLWQKNEKDNSVNSQEIKGTWCQIHHGEYVIPDSASLEAIVNGIFYSDKIIGNCGLLSYVFNQGTNLTVTTLFTDYHGRIRNTELINQLTNQDNEIAPHEVTENLTLSIKWHSFTRPLYSVTSASRLVKGRSVYVCRHSPDGQLLAIVLNQKYARDTKLLFCSPVHGNTTIADMKCCGGYEDSLGRIWWVSEIAWTNDSLFLIGITRNGALFMASKLGEPVGIITSGSRIGTEPRLFLPLHPRITVRSFQENIPPETSEISSGSEKGGFHQKFSVAVHPRLPYFLCSDGYNVTMFQLKHTLSAVDIMTNFIQDISDTLPSAQDLALKIPDKVTKKVDATEHLKPATFLSNMATPSQDSSPGSTLSSTFPGLGITKNMESGVIMFGDVDDNIVYDGELQGLEDKKTKAKRLLLQALAYGTCAGPHWSGDMAIAMNLVIHAYAKLLWCLFECDLELSSSFNNSKILVKTTMFVKSILELFRWDIKYQHCLPWLSQLATSTVTSLTAFEKFECEEVINVSITLLKMIESVVEQVYNWYPLSNVFTVHILGDTFSPMYVADMTALESKSDSRLAHKLERAWLVLHTYITKKYEVTKSSASLTEQMCFVQTKLQDIRSVRNLAFRKNFGSQLVQAQKFYLENKYVQAVSTLKKIVRDMGEKYEIDQSMLSEWMENQSTLKNKQNTCSSELSHQLIQGTNCLLNILYIYLEKYDLKSALELVYSFINTTGRHDLLYFLNGNVEPSDSVLFEVDSQASIAFTSSVKLQLSLLTKYPLAWVTDNTVLPVVQCFARLMTCYFTNSPLVIPVPFQLNTQYNGNNDEEKTVGNVRNLLQQKVTDAVAEQKLAHFWTVDHAMKLLIVSGLLHDAACFSDQLGEWKLAFFLSTTTMLHNMVNKDLYQAPRFQYYFPVPKNTVQPDQLMVNKIKSVLQLDEDWSSATGFFENDERTVSCLKASFKASVVAGLDLVPDVLKNILTVLQANISKLNWIVAQELYLPAPPLYCPQPARNDEGILSEEMKSELRLRSQIAVIVQKVIAVFRSCNCFLLCASEYCHHLSGNLATEQVEALPSVIKEFLVSDRFHSERKFYREDSCMEDSQIQVLPTSIERILTSFQKFCGLMWFLRVRDKVSASARSYSKIKQNMSMMLSDDENGGDENESATKNCQEQVLNSLKRMLLFPELHGSTSDILDGVLTVLSEMPLTSDTVEILAEYFHTSSFSLNLSTHDKLKRLSRRLRNTVDPTELGDGKPLSNVYEEKCREKRSDISQNIPKNDTCHNAVYRPYEDDAAFITFLDTFLLITVSKSITKDISREIPLLLCCREHLENDEFLEKDIQLNNLSMKSEDFKSKGIQRSQSVHDMRAKVSSRTPRNENQAMHRSRSLTNLAKVDKGNLSEGLQEMLPKLIWLKKWCSLEESEKGRRKDITKGVQCESSPQTGIRVRVSLRLILNTLWLMENYYKEFVDDSNRCVKELVQNEKCVRISNKKSARRRSSSALEKKTRQVNSSFLREEQNTVGEKVGDDHNNEGLSSYNTELNTTITNKNGAIETYSTEGIPLSKITSRKPMEQRSELSTSTPHKILSDNSGESVGGLPASTVESKNGQSPNQSAREIFELTTNPSTAEEHSATATTLPSLPLLSGNHLKCSTSEKNEFQLPLLSLDKSKMDQYEDVGMTSGGEILWSWQPGSTSAMNPASDDFDSMSSETFSIGQVKGDLTLCLPGITQHKMDISKASDTNESFHKTNKRNSDKENKRTNNDNEAALFRRIVRSEMRKFIKSQQAGMKSQSSVVNTTEEEVLKNKLNYRERGGQETEYMKERKNKPRRLKEMASPLTTSSRRRTRNTIPTVDESSSHSPYSTTDNSSSSSLHFDSKDRVKSKVPKTNKREDAYRAPVTNYVNQWPFWTQGPFPAAPPWLWQSYPTKTIDNKAIQVTSPDTVSDINKDDNIRHDDARVSQDDDLTIKCSSDVKTVNVAVQTKDTENVLPDVTYQYDKEKVERINLDNDRERKHAKANDPGKDSKVDEGVQEEELLLNLGECSSMGNSPVAAGDSQSSLASCNANNLEAKPESESRDDHSDIPFLYIPPNLPMTPPKIPFKIAWPSPANEVDSPSDETCMPLLQFGNVDKDSQPNDQHDEITFPDFTLKNISDEVKGDIPLLNLPISNQNSRKGLENFSLLQFPINREIDYHLPQAPPDERALFPISDGFTGKGTNIQGSFGFVESRSKQEGVSSNAVPNQQSVGASSSRVRRRRADVASFKEMKQTTTSDPIYKHDSGKEILGTVVEVQPESAVTHSKATKRRSKRRDKLQELNNIIRDLERDISDSSDLVFSEVSEILHNEIKYENFEKKSKRSTADGPKSHAALVNEATRRNNGVGEYSKISNAYKASDVKARDIHTEYSIAKPMVRLFSDANVGTRPVPSLTASVQTHDTVYPSNIRGNSGHEPSSGQVNDNAAEKNVQSVVPIDEAVLSVPVEQSKELLKVIPKTNTREFSIQTDVPKQTLRPNVCDAGMNTDGAQLLINDHQTNPLYPRFPPQSYVLMENVGENVITSSWDHHDVPREMGQRNFISVADMDENAVRRQIEEVGQTNVSLESEKSSSKEHRTKSMVIEQESLAQPKNQPDSQRSSNHDNLQGNIVDNVGDLTTTRVFSSLNHPSEINRASVSRKQQPRQVAKGAVSQKFEEMNEHIDVIDRIAENMDRELQRSNMLLHAIDQLNQIKDHTTSSNSTSQQLDKSTTKYKVSLDHTSYKHLANVNESCKPLLEDVLSTNKTSELGPLKIADHEEKGTNNREVSLGSNDDINCGAGSENDDIVDKRDENVIPGHGRGVNSSRENTRENKVVEIKKTETPKNVSRSGTIESKLRHEEDEAADQTVLSEKTLKDILNANSSSISHSRPENRTPGQREELRKWMSNKRKVLHKEWVAGLNEKREAEHQPFKTGTALSSKKLKMVEKERRDIRKTQKQEIVSERMNTAYDLISQMIEEPIPKQRISSYKPTRSNKNSGAKKHEKPRIKRNNRYNKSENATNNLSGTYKLKKSEKVPQYNYDIEESARQFITRKSYERYQSKMSQSLSLDRSFTSGVFKMTDDSRINELLRDVSSTTFERANMGDLDSILNSDSELRELLNDVIVDQKEHSKPSLYNNMDERSNMAQVLLPRGKMLQTFAIDEKYDGMKHREPGSMMGDVEHFDESDEVAALLAEAKAAVGDDFSGNSEIEDIDWTEVDNALQEG